MCLVSLSTLQKPKISLLKNSLKMRLLLLVRLTKTKTANMKMLMTKMTSEFKRQGVCI
jgi:hypothetical protein